MGLASKHSTEQQVNSTKHLSFQVQSSRWKTPSLKKLKKLKHPPTIPSSLRRMRMPQKLPGMPDREGEVRGGRGTLRTDDCHRHQHRQLLEQAGVVKQKRQFNNAKVKKILRFRVLHFNRI